jgi:hypothetical protein
MASLEPLAEPQSQQRPPTGLSFGDGFQFGCGFFIAGLIATVILILIVALIALALSMTGFGLLSNLLG